MVSEGLTSRKIKARGKVFRDPVHRLIRVEPGDEFILDLIDTPEFQRLRRIRQLGVSWMTYPGAEHGRFSHSLGVFNFAQRIHRSLFNRYLSDDAMVFYLQSHRKVLLAAALLHDIGHGPFSHMIERAFGQAVKHENKTIELIKDPEGRVAEILGGHGIDPQEVAEIIEGTSKDRLIVDIVSSQLDADRMDYLLRDSLFTGVEYGRYDAEWIIRNLCVGIDGSVEKNKEDHDFARHRLCLDQDRGLYSAEQLILARTHMTMQVYMHRVTRGYEVHLLCLFKLAAKCASEGTLPDGTPDVVREYFLTSGKLDKDQWIRFDETAMFSAMSCWAQADGEGVSDLQRLSDSFLKRESVFRARVLGQNVDFNMGRELDKVAEEDIHWAIDEGKCQQYKGLYYEGAKRKEKPGSTKTDSILLASGEVGEFAFPVEIKSQLFKSLDASTQVVRRIYFDANKADVIEPVLDQFGVTEVR